MLEAREGELAEQRVLKSPNALGDAHFNVAPPAPVEAIFARVPTPLATL